MAGREKTSKQIMEAALGYSLESVDYLRKQFKAGRLSLERMWKLLDAYDSGKFWDTMKAKLPKHQIIPDTNLIYRAKCNLVNSVYSSPYVADVVAIDPDDMDQARQINKFVQKEYSNSNLAYYQIQIGERAALLNIGFLQVGWDDSYKETVGNIEMKGQAIYVPRDPQAVLLDPQFVDFQNGRAVFIDTVDSIENVLATYPQAAKELKKAMGIRENGVNFDYYSVVSPTSAEDVGKSLLSPNVPYASNGLLPIWIAFKKVPKDGGGYRIDQIIYTSNQIVLDFTQGIRPNYFPIIPLQDEPPIHDPWGIGVCARLLRNALSYNVLDSVIVTHTYAAQRTPWLLDTRSGLSPARVLNDINNPDRVFPIQEGDVEKTLKRLEYPELPKDIVSIKQDLRQSISEISGIDEKYTGRDTGSVTTTGGMERLQQRVSLTDNTRIVMVEKYARELTQMIVDFYTEFGGKRVFMTSDRQLERKIEELQQSGKQINASEVRDKSITAMTIDFNELKSDKSLSRPNRFNFTIHAAPLLPKSRARLAEAANTIMQVQLQFAQSGQQVELLTPEEWLYFQDFPQKDLILDRMVLDRLRNDEEEIASELANFGALTEQGMRPEMAVQQLAKERAISREPSTRKNLLKNA